MTTLPLAFCERMQDMLGGEYPAFLACYEQSYRRGIRLNIEKCEEERLHAALPFSITTAPFSPLSYYIPEGVEHLGALPFHHAGAFYVQEPSAASAVTVLSPQPGDRVLDLCAAPGGKSTQIAALLAGQGLLWSNEVVRNRANVLLSNIERMGVRNAVVSCCRPETLCDALEGFFDKVLVDAPCSGEGMFRRDERAIQEWSPEHVKMCAVRQLAILETASQALCEGGILVYSTCTFSFEENEGVVEAFLKKRPDFALLDCGVSFGRPGSIPQTRRIFPMDGGEGHFVAKLQRLSENGNTPSPYNYAKPSELAKACCEMLYKQMPSGVLEQIGDNLLLLPDGLPQMKGLGILRAGVLLGTYQKRIEPAHAAFMAARPESLCNVLELTHEGPQIAAFLHGEELDVPESLKGYTGVAVDGIVTGFGKCSGGRLKNRYPKGLRNHEIHFMQDF